MCGAWFNISDFVYTLHHNVALAWTVAIALAASLVVFSALLSDIKWGSNGFSVNLVVVSGLTAISGAIQGAAYANAVGWPGWLMGFSMPLFGELGASLALSFYAKEQHARSMDEAQRQLSDGVRKTIIDALGNVDRAKVEQQVNRAVGTITRELIDASIHDMVAELRAGRSAIVTESDARPVAEIATQTVKLPAPLDTTRPEIRVKNGEPILAPNCQTTSLIDTRSFAERMADARRKKTLDRQNTLYDILRNEFAGAASDDVNKSELAERLGVSRQTVIKDFEALEAGQRIAVNGHVAIL